MKAGYQAQHWYRLCEGSIRDFQWPGIALTLKCDCATVVYTVTALAEFASLTATNTVRGFNPFTTAAYLRVEPEVIMGIVGALEAIGVTENGIFPPGGFWRPFISSTKRLKIANARAKDPEAIQARVTKRKRRKVPKEELWARRQAKVARRREATERALERELRVKAEQKAGIVAIGTQKTPERVAERIRSVVNANSGNVSVQQEDYDSKSILAAGARLLKHNEARFSALTPEQQHRASMLGNVGQDGSVSDDLYHERSPAADLLDDHALLRDELERELDDPTAPDPVLTRKRLMVDGQSPLLDKGRELECD